MGSPFTTQIESLREILRVIEQKAPRNQDGVLERPYYYWATELHAGITKAEKWQKSLEGQKGGEREDNSG